ncbi:MAG: ATP-binding cassette domain-containing protein, partial [Eubacteriaceae bacterium]|nr:ATP-binding cassette domain-containing protein [Eubacteriaceae bacterium]
FGIQGWFHRDVSELSGGQKQLLNLASIMAMQPKVLILDEPTSQLDPIAASDFLNTVRKINLELGTTIIMTEHRLEDILHASDRVVVMEEGRILTTGSPRDIGDELRRKESDMFSAMPSPVQIFYAVGGKGDCPLTVREGRTFLSESFSDREISIDSVKEEEPFDGEIAGPALEVKEVWFRYEKDLPDVLKGVSLSVPKGSLFAIVGGNGTGKSTLLRCISSALVPYRGDIKVFGKSLKKYKTSELFKGNLSMLPQDPKCLFVKKTVKEDLYEMLPAGDKQKDEKVKEVSEICDIERLLSSHPYDLSGGEQQRAALAKVLLTEPLLLLLDEPTKGMDSFFKIRFAGILDDLKKRGVTVVMVSHDIEFCAKYADLVSMFFDGGVVTTNTPNRFFSQNSFYTTAANRMSRHVFRNAVNSDDVITLYKENMKI